MTYVELIVVLSIFSVLSSVVVFNYGDFQARIDIKNLASDIALKVVEAQKSSLSGNLSTSSFGTNKPSYGVYFNITTNPMQFIYFANLNNVNGYESGELILDTVNITKGNYVSNIDKCSTSPCTSGSNPINVLSIAFIRPNSRAIFTGASIVGSEYIQITIKSPKGATALIKIYPSGRIQVN